jgi:hypothetical protein
MENAGRLGSGALPIQSIVRLRSIAGLYGEEFGRRILFARAAALIVLPAPPLRKARLPTRLTALHGYATMSADNDKRQVWSFPASWVR